MVNPINELTRLLALIHDEHGRIQFPGLYDRVESVSEEVGIQWQNLGFDEAALGAIGLPGHGEKGYSALERTWCRPTCDISGILGGYTGKGTRP